MDIFFTYLVSEQANLKWGGVILVSKLIQKTVRNGRILQGLYYIPIGALFAAKKNKFFNRIILGVGTAVTFIIATFTNFILFALVCRVFFFAFVLSTKIEYSKIFYYLRKSSAVMYFTHMIFYAIWMLLDIQKYGLIAFLWTLSLSALTSGAVILQEKDKRGRKFVKMLFG